MKIIRNAILKFIERGLNRLKLREKIIGLFIFCVIIPLVCIDGIVLWNLIDGARTENVYVAEKMSESVENYFDGIIKGCQNIAFSIGQNYYVGEVLATNYGSTYDYYDQYHKMTDNYFFQNLLRFENMKIKIYTTNPTIVGGGYVGRVDSIEDTYWYKEYIESGKTYYFKCDFDDSRRYNESKRRVYYIARLNYNNNAYKNFIRIDMDYSTLARALENMGHSMPIYLFDGDTLLFSNQSYNLPSVPFSELSSIDNVIYEEGIGDLGNIDRLVVVNEGIGVFDFFKRNFPLLIVVILISVILPMFVLYVIDYSIVHRIEKLNRIFGTRVDDELLMIDEPDGSDEIGNLMKSYNKMANEVNSLIKIVYKDKLRKQEMNIAKKNAELLALQSQINPHFMFNALESIRMHSVIKGEGETAEMVEKLAVLERQYVDWGSDMVKISQEMSTVEAYLILQKYRFGDKLRYELSIDEECKDKLIPKLTIVTFAENACVHGMENKTSECWVFVRVYKEADATIIEIEDTGSGIEESMVMEINQMAKTVELDDLMKSSHVGIYNALLRLKMTMGEGYHFEIESEEGIGTMIQIVIPEDTSKDMMIEDMVEEL